MFERIVDGTHINQQHWMSLVEYFSTIATNVYIALGFGEWCSFSGYGRWRVSPQSTFGRQYITCDPCLSIKSYQIRLNLIGQLDLKSIHGQTESNRCPYRINGFAVFFAQSIHNTLTAGNSAARRSPAAASRTHKGGASRSEQVHWTRYIATQTQVCSVGTKLAEMELLMPIRMHVWCTITNIRWESQK